MNSTLYNLEECTPEHCDQIGKHVFLLAAGSAERWNGRCKQQICIRGEILIERTIRQIRRILPGTDISIVSYNKNLKYPGIRYIDTHHKTPCIAQTIALTVPYWGDMNYLLVTDVYYTDAYLTEILGTKTLSWFGYRKKDPKYLLPVSERIGVSIPLKDRPWIVPRLTSLIGEYAIYQNEAANQIPGFSWPGWKIAYYRYLHSRWTVIRGIAWFVFYQIQPVILGAKPMLYTTDPRVSEFDDPHDLEEWCNHVPTE